MSYYCAECGAELNAEELVDDEDGDAICCPYCETVIPELDPLNQEELDKDG